MPEKYQNVTLSNSLDYDQTFALTVAFPSTTARLQQVYLSKSNTVAISLVSLNLAQKNVVVN